MEVVEKAAVPISVLNTIRFLQRSFSPRTEDDVGFLRNLRDFADSLHLLHGPGKRYQHWMGEIAAAVSEWRKATDQQLLQQLAAKARKLFEKLIADCLTETPNVGSENRIFAQQHRAKVIEAFSEPGQPGLLSLSTFDPVKVKVSRDETDGMQPLRKYSESLAGMHLAQFGSDPVDLPQQPFEYISRPAPFTAPRITGFHSTIYVMDSLQRPKRLQLHCSDEKMYQVLVKGGDDLRLDQRIEQIFSSVNALLEQTTAEYGLPRLRLTLRTYSVVPVSKLVGLVQWLPGTEPLKAVIQGVLRRGGTNRTTDLRGSTEFFQFYSRLSESPVLALLKGYTAFDNAESRFSAMVQGWIDTIPRSLLLQGLMGCCADIARFYALRRRFMHSTAALAMLSHILSIGDRHLANFLLDTATGDVVGIDFGHALGQGIMRTQVPELAPFRLTPQIVAALGPLGEDALRCPMSLALETLRKGRFALLGLCSAFLREPLSIWKDTKSDASDGARARLQSVRDKLNLCSPVDTALRDVCSNRAIRDIRKEVERVVIGEPLERPRGDLPSENAYVDVLIGMAVDRNILGRMWFGWEPLL
jgi:DNA-dependent protein kinase catalytic subunit